MHRALPLLLVTVLSLTVTLSIAAQQAPAAQPLDIGTMAPDFELTGATRFGILRDAVRLSDYHGKTVVLAFFFRARTRG